MRRFRVEIEGKVYEVNVEEITRGEGATAPITEGLKSTSRAPAVTIPKRAKIGGKTIAAPMMGTILEVSVKQGDEVKTGQVVARMDAMKMEIDVVSDYEGRVKEVRASKGESIQSGDPIVVLE
jgi:biotin carboxyl carrier protein